MSEKFNVSFGSNEEEMKLYALALSGKSKYVKKCIKFFEENIEFANVWKQLCNEADNSLKMEHIKKALEFYNEYKDLEVIWEQILEKTGKKGVENR